MSRRPPIESFLQPPVRRVEAASPASPELSAEQRWVQEEIETKHASLSGGTFYDWLEVRKTTDSHEIKKAFARLIKKYHPDRHRSKSLESLSSKLEEIVTKVTQAHETLADPLSRRRYDNSLRTEAPRGEVVTPKPKPEPAEPAAPSVREKTADHYYREAKRYFQKRDYHETVKLMQEAVELDPGKIRYHCLLAQALAHNPKWRRSAEEHFKTALEMDPFDTDSLVGLAELYESVGLNRRAHALYAEAVEIDPGNAILRMKARGLD